MAEQTNRSSFLTALIDPFSSADGYAEQAYRPRLSRRAWGLPLLGGLALLVLSLVGWVVNPARFYFSYLVGWTFCLTLSLGSLFFVMVHHITRARWFTVVRRIPEALAWSFPLLALLFIPLLFGMHDLYHWTHEGIADPSSSHYDEILAGKTAYLNETFFYIRMVLYFVVWTYLSHRLYSLSIHQDTRPSEDIPDKLRFVSAWGILAFSITTAFASYDLLMSLDPHWFSTIFGVYFFAGSFLSGMALLTVFYLSLQWTQDALRNIVTIEHYHDLGKYLFGFVAFWAYIAFSQYMLIWYGNIPEETIWFRHRLEHGWSYFTYALVFGHFAIPFLFLMPRFVKRFRPTLAFMAVWILVMHWIDLYWVAMPVYDVAHGGHASFHWIDLTCWLGLFGVFVGTALFRLSRHALVPQNDPYLVPSIHFENA